MGKTSRGTKRAALALAVSLWMAAGSVASAEVTVESTADAETKATDPGAVLNKATSGLRIYSLKTGTEMKLAGGDCTNAHFAAGYSAGGNVSGYTLTVDSGTFSDGNTLAGGWSRSGTANNNIVHVNGGGGTQSNYRPKIDGGYADGGVSHNIVVVTGGTVGSVYGGETRDGDANGNTVTVSGGDVLRVYGGKSTDGAAKNNVVTISGGTVRHVYGGLSNNGAATDNTVNILAAVSLREIYGGSGNPSSGNTVNFAEKNITVESINSVQNLNFYLPADIAANDTMVTVTGGDKTDLAGVTVGAAALSGVSLAQGDKVTLLKNANGFTGTAATATLTTPPKATSLTVDTSYKFTVTQNANDITATFGEAVESDASERAKSLVETRAAATTFINVGADMLASQGFAQAANAVALDAAERVRQDTATGESGGLTAPTAGGFTPFAAFGGSSLRAESGSYVNTKGFGLNVGFARELSNAQGKLLFGPMVEYGGGSYDSHLDDGTRGDGKAHYFGVGLMARQVNHDGFYYEGSLRGGRVSSDYRGNLDGLGAVEYDSASPYIAAHLGAGKVFSLGNGNSIDGYCKYFYSRQSGDDATIRVANAADEQGSFDAVNSHRIRLGARFTRKVNERNSFYGGLAYQYEFKGDARAHFSGNAAPSPSVKGSSGMLELGWQVKPGDGPLTLDLGFTGWAGRQRGGSVQLGATWSF